MNQREIERMTKLEAKVDNLEKGQQELKSDVKEGFDKIEQKLDAHVEWEADKYDKLDEKFVHRLEFNYHINELKEENKKQDKETNWLKKNQWKLLERLAWVVGAGAGTKVVGLW